MDGTISRFYVLRIAQENLKVKFIDLKISIEETE